MLTIAAFFLTHGHAGLELGVSAYAGTTFYDAQGANAGQRMNNGLWVNHRAGMHLRPGCIRKTFLPELGDAGKIQIGLVRHNAGAAQQGHGQHLGADDYTSRLGSC